jgi:hypothetical protein
VTDGLQNPGRRSIAAKRVVVPNELESAEVKQCVMLNLVETGEGSTGGDLDSYEAADVAREGFSANPGRVNIEVQQPVLLNLLETVEGSMCCNLDCYEEKAKEVEGHVSIIAVKCEVLSVSADARSSSSMPTRCVSCRAVRRAMPSIPTSLLLRLHGSGSVRTQGV